MKVYPSKRDAWLVAVGWGIALLAVACAAPAFALASRGELIVLLAIVAAVDAVVLWVIYGTVYWFEGTMLRIRCGPLRVQVPVSLIESVEPTRDASSSPACSLDRLMLRYADRRILISPREREAFLEDLQGRCPALRRINC